MKIKILSLALLIVASLLMSFDGKESKTIDNCTGWQKWGDYGREAKIYLKVCEYDSGGSGYTKFKNSNNKAVRISFEFTFYNGKVDKNNSTKINAYSETNPSSCYSCARKNGGLKSWKITKIAFEGEKGFW